MLSKLVLITALFPAALPRAVPEELQSLLWWTVSPLEKVRPFHQPPAHPAHGAVLYAGRNEFEPFQIVLRSATKDLPEVDIEFSDLVTASGAKISSKNITVFLEHFLNLDRPSSDEGAAGLWPDPLLPRTDRYANERRKAFPFVVRRGSNQPLWVEIFVPPTADPGVYAGSARISLGARTRYSVPIRLTVWNFTLPSTSTLKSSFGLSGITALRQHRGRYTNDADLHSITRLYAKAALIHRVSIHVGSMVSPAYTYEDGKMRMDWRAYDAEIAPFLNGTLIAQGEPLHGARVTSVDLRAPPAIVDKAQQVLYWTEWTKHFQQNGWLDRLFLYLFDEPAAKDFPKVLERGQLSQLVTPKIRNLVTTPFTTKLGNVVRIWAPLVNCLEAKPGFDDFCSPTPPRAVYGGEIEKGGSLWFYQSCASHGCNIIGGSYFNGWPSYMIDMQGAANRVMQWLAWKFHIDGELYYSMNEAYASPQDPWTNVRLSGGNGDGTLFYPGRPDRIGGRTDIPIESIRLKLIREGMEDYEYLALLATLSGSKAADAYADRIVKKPYLWESRPETFLKVRQELGVTLDRLATVSADH